MRYRKLSLKSALGVTKAKRRLKKDLGVYKVTRYTNAPKNAKSKLKRKAGYYSDPMKFLRYLGKLFR